MSWSPSASGGGVGSVSSRLARFAAGSRPPWMSRSTPILKNFSAGSGLITSTSASSPSSSIVRSRPIAELGGTPTVNQMLKSCSRS